MENVETNNSDNSDKTLLRFPEVEQFRHVARNVGFAAQFQGLDAENQPIINKLAKLPALTFEGTVKLHGTCSGVKIQNGVISCQSRNRVITPESDNAGFARFINDLPEEAINQIKEIFGDNIVIHGEWAGKGIQDTVAISQVDKFWAIFGAKTISEDENGSWINLEEKDLSSLNPYRIYSIRQFGVEKVEIDFERPAESINLINELSLKVEEECPAGKFFGISGIGEGRVWRPVDQKFNSSRYVFKVKGQAHSKSKVRKLANVDVEKMKSIEDFVEKHLSEERLVQAWNWLEEQKMEQTEKSTGSFIKWLFNDIIKEEGDELAASNLQVKDLGGMVAKKAKLWFFGKIKQF